MKISRVQPASTENPEPTVTPVTPQRSRSKPLSSSLLPTGKSQRISSISDISLLLYGEMKAGKTSLTSQFPDTVHIMLEPGGKDLEIAKVERPDMNWATFVAVIDELLASDRFQTVAIDTVQLAYDMCLDGVCHDRGLSHPSDKEDFGGTWSAVAGEFSRQMTRLLQSGRGVIFIAHADETTFSTRMGAEYKKIVPALSKQARLYLKAVADVTAYYGYYGSDRYLTIQGSDSLDAGHRLKAPRFRTSSGVPIHSIPMFDPEDPLFDEVRAYQNFFDAFEGRQVDPGLPGSAPALTETKPVKRDKRR